MTLYEYEVTLGVHGGIKDVVAIDSRPPVDMIAAWRAALVSHEKRIRAGEKQRDFARLRGMHVQKRIAEFSHAPQESDLMDLTPDVVGMDELVEFAGDEDRVGYALVPSYLVIAISVKRVQRKAPVQHIVDGGAAP